MTTRLYYTCDDTEGRATVLNCTAEPDGRYAIELDSTLFHPQGGGQPADCGWIDDQPVESVVARDARVIHILPRPLPPGEVVLRVDASLRHLHARLHSAGHLIGLAGEQCGWRPVKAHHWPGEGRITFSAGKEAVPASALQDSIRVWQAAGLPRHITFHDGLRQVGFGDLPAYACGGTHVERLSALGEVAITQVKMKKGQMVVYYTLQP